MRLMLAAALLAFFLPAGRATKPGMAKASLVAAQGMDFIEVRKEISNELKARNKLSKK